MKQEFMVRRFWKRDGLKRPPISLETAVNDICGLTKAADNDAASKRHPALSFAGGAKWNRMRKKTLHESWPLALSPISAPPLSTAVWRLPG